LNSDDATDVALSAPRGVKILPATWFDEKTIGGAK